MEKGEGPMGKLIRSRAQWNRGRGTRAVKRALRRNDRNERVVVVLVIEKPRDGEGMGRGSTSLAERAQYCARTAWGEGEGEVAVVDRARINRTRWFHSISRVVGKEEKKRKKKGMNE